MRCEDSAHYSTAHCNSVQPLLTATSAHGGTRTTARYLCRADRGRHLHVAPGQYVGILVVAAVVLNIARSAAGAFASATQNLLNGKRTCCLPPYHQADSTGTTSSVSAASIVRWSISAKPSVPCLSTAETDLLPDSNFAGAANSSAAKRNAMYRPRITSTDQRAQSGISKRDPA